MFTKSPNKNMKQRNTDISSSYILANIEKELVEIKIELVSKPLISKMNSVLDTIKLLTKKLEQSDTDYKNIQSSNSLNKHSSLDVAHNEKDIRKSKINYEENLGKAYLELENKKLRDEISKLKKDTKTSDNSKGKRSNRNSYDLNDSGENENDKKPMNTDNSINDKKMHKKIEVLTYQLNEEKSVNREMILQVQNLENALKKLSTEYNSLSYRFSKLNTESEGFVKTIANLNNNLMVNKKNLEEYHKVNEKLKEIHFDKEKFIEEHNKDITQYIKKCKKLSSIKDQSDKYIMDLISDNKIKDEKLKALRNMNIRLENKINMILKKWEELGVLEKKTEDSVINYQKKFDMIEEQEKRITELINANDEQKRNDTHLQRIINSQKEENAKLVRQNNDLRKMNDELNNRIDNFENKFKNNINLLTNTVVVDKQQTNSTLSNMVKTISKADSKQNSNLFNSLNTQQLRDKDGKDSKDLNSGMTTNTNTYRMASSSISPNTKNVSLL